MPETRIVAYDNVTFSKMMLSMFPSKTEYNVRPFPDFLITNGPLYRNVLVEGGYPPERIRVGCALRHAYLWDKTITGHSNTNRKHEGKRLTLLVASAISHGDSIDIISKISTAFGGDVRYNIQIKCHPLINMDDLKKSLGSIIDHQNITFTDKPIRTVLASANILFYTYTSVCYEALQFKVPPVFVHLENFLNLDKLDIAPDVRWTATTQQDLKKVVSEIVQMSTDRYQIWEERAEQIVKDALQPVGSDCIEKFVGD
jgi:surface carbohydrate biosynthesis protein (TIGR04326 family)